MPTSSREPITDKLDSTPAPRSESPLHPVSLLAGAGAAAVAAVIGGQLGVSGTVAGAAIGSLVAALAGTAIRHSAQRSSAAVAELARRRRSGEVLEESPPTRPRALARRGVIIGAGFALGILGLLAVQLGLGRYLSPGSGQLQEAAAHVVAPTHVTQRPTASHSAAQPTATTTVTQTASTPTASSSSVPAAYPVKAPSTTSVPVASTSASTLQPTAPTT